MRDQRPLDQLDDEVTSQVLVEVQGSVWGALVEYRAELEYEFRLFLDFPTDGNQSDVQDRCARYRHLWMRAHARLVEEEEEGKDE